MKITLFCNAGLSTGMLVGRMQKSAAPGDEIAAYEFSCIKDMVKGSDVVLLGPQIRFKLKDAKAVCDPLGIPCDIISMVAYGRADGEAAYKQAKELYENK